MLVVCLCHVCSLVKVCTTTGIDWCAWMCTFTYYGIYICIIRLQLHSSRCHADSEGPISFFTDYRRQCQTRDDSTPLLQRLNVNYLKTNNQNPLTITGLQNTQPAYKESFSAPTMALQKMSLSKNNITLLHTRNSQQLLQRVCLHSPQKLLNLGLPPGVIMQPLLSSGNSIGQAVKTLSPCISWQPSQSQWLGTAWQMSQHRP